MNKNLKIALSVVLLMGLLIGGWVTYSVYGPKTAIEDILPSGAMAFLSLKNPSVHLHKGVESEFWKSVSTIDLPRILKQNKFSKSKIQRIEQGLNDAKLLINNPVTQKFLDKEIAVGIYSNAKSEYEILAAIRLPASIQAAELMGSFIHQWGDEVIATQEQIQGQRIVHLQLKKKNISLKYIRIKDVLVISPETSEILNQVIAVRMQTDKALGSDGGIVFSKSHAYPKADGLFYFNVKALNNIFRDEGEVFNKEQMHELLGLTSGFKTYAVSFLPGDVFKFKLILGFEPEALKPPLRRLLACKPMENLSLGFVLPNVIAYQWSGCYDFKESWQQMKEQLHGSIDVESQVVHFKRALEKRWHINIETDLLPLLGQDAGGYLTDIDTLGMFPFPRFLIFVNVTDRSKAQDLLSRIIKSPLGLIQQEEYNNVDLRYLSLPLGANMDPGYCFIGNYLLVASSRQLLKKSIDTYKDPAQSLKFDKTFKLFDLGNHTNQGISYIKTGDMARRMLDLLNWGNKYLSSQVSSVGSYKQEGQAKINEIAIAIASKQEELDLGIAKLQDPDLNPDFIEPLQKDVESLGNDIKTYQAQTKELEDALLSYDDQVQGAKLLMFNLQQIIEPVLKGFVSSQAQGIKVLMNEQAIETEFMFK